MKFKKYICVRYHHLTQKSYKEYYLEEAQNAGIIVEYWDTTFLFFTDDYGQEDSSYLAKTRKISTFSELEQAIQEQDIKNTLFVTTSTFEYKVRKLHLLFARHNCIVAGFGRNMYPVANSKPLKRLKRITPRRIFNYLLNRYLDIEVKFDKIKTFDIVFLAGEKGWQALGRISECKLEKMDVIRINSCDYDTCIENQNDQCLFAHNYILYLDQYLPLHPDMLMVERCTIPEDLYYHSLNDYFSKLEKKMGMPVVIAAHPKALKYKEKNYFDGRLVLFDQTQQLSKYATVVLAHNSVSINYPIIYGIPLHFITSAVIEKYAYSVHHDVQIFAEMFGSDWEYWDDPRVSDLNFRIDRNKYASYKFLYQSSPDAEQRLTKNIFIDFLLGK